MNTLKMLYDLFLKSDYKVCTDTRKLVPNSIFFALKGENFNANSFALRAIDSGCACAVIDDPTYHLENDKTILVEDVLITLQKLAQYHRSQLKIPVIAITGSNGKTTTKELINAVLSKKYTCLATWGNLNNHIGVPLTLLSITKEHEIAIIEMGANHQKEIDFLCTLADPDFGVITNIGKAHLEGFGGIEGVKKGKSELYRYLKTKKGKVFLHADDPVLTDLAKENETITYGTNGNYDVIGKLNTNNYLVDFAWKTKENSKHLAEANIISTNLVGLYNYYNLLCAACVGAVFNVAENLINDALKAYNPSNNRSQMQRTQKNTLILDYYNANPTSMAAAIENFSKINATKKLLILGDMLELGEEAKSEHIAIVDLLKEKGLDKYLLIGPIFKSLGELDSFTTSKEAAEYLKSIDIAQHIILIKGSRGIKLEEVIGAL